MTKPEISIINTARPCYKFQNYINNYLNKTYKGVKCYQFNMKLEVAEQKCIEPKMEKDFPINKS